MYMLFNVVCDVRVDNSDTTLEAVVEVTLSSATSKNLSLDDHVIALCARLVLVPSGYESQSVHTNGLSYILSLLCVVSDIALRDLDTVLIRVLVPVFRSPFFLAIPYRVKELRRAPLVDREVAALLESRLPDRSVLESLG